MPDIPKPITHDLELACKELEDLNGNLKLFLSKHSMKELFLLEKLFQNPEFVDYRRRWRNAIYFGEKIRIDLLRCKAIDVLEKFCPDSKAPEVTFAKVLLSDHFVDSAETAKQRVFKAFGVRQRTATEDTPSAEDEVDILEQELVNGRH